MALKLKGNSTVTKKTKNAIETNLEITETTEEETTTLSAEQQYYNAGQEIERIKATIEEKREAIQDHMARIADLQEQHRDAQQDYEAAQANEQAHVAQVERQQALAKIGGLAEQATLHAMIAVQDNLAKISEAAQNALQKAENGLAEIDGIIDAIEQIKADSEQLERELEVMRSLEREMLFKWGKDEQAALIEDLEAAQAEFNEKETDYKASRSSLQDMQESIRERLRYWPGLADQVQKDFLQIIPAEEYRTTAPAEHIARAYLAYLKVLAEHGAAMQGLDHKNMGRFTGVLDLNPSALRGFFSYDYAFKQHRIGIAEDYLHERPWLGY